MLSEFYVYDYDFKMLVSNMIIKMLKHQARDSKKIMHMSRERWCSTYANHFPMQNPNINVISQVLCSGPKLQRMTPNGEK